MKFKLLLIVMAVTFLLPLSVITAFPWDALAQGTESVFARIEVSRKGFNNTAGEFRLEVEQGQEVVITFVYGDGDFPQNNPHVMFISGYNIKTDILDRENPEVTVRFIADRPGEVNFMCILVCMGHENLQRGRIIILPSTGTQVVGEGGQLRLTALEQAQSGRPLTLTAVLRDNEGKPMGNVLVKFFIKVDFFINGMVEIGEALTNDQGVAVLEYTPRLVGETQVVARHEGGSHETAITVSLAGTGEPFYQTEAGIRLPVPGKDVLIGPKSALEPGDGGLAPMTAFRLPGSILSWLWLFAGVVILVWLTYFRVIYQVFRIPSVKEMEDTNTRLVPLIGMVVIVVLGILLVLIILTGPYTHLQLLR